MKDPSIFFTADPHFLHDAIIIHCSRPFINCNKMNKNLVRNWNDTVSSEDHVYILGDFAWGGVDKKYPMEIITRNLNGHKHLIYGNHDRLHPFEYIEIGFDSTHSALEIYDGKILLAHDPSIGTCLKPEQVLLHGHLHRELINNTRFINVGVDVFGFKPVSLETILQIFRERGIKL